MSRSEPSFAPAEDRPPTLCEVFADTAADGAATGFVLAQPSKQGPVIWIQDRISRREGGRPYAAGLAGLLGRPMEMLYLEVGRAVDVLWAMEEALGCPALSLVVGEVWGDPPALDFTATKRLAIRAEARGVAAWLLRRAATPDLSAARERWRVRSQPTLAHLDDLRAPGEPLWLADLFRSRHGRTGTWLARRHAEFQGSPLGPQPVRESASAGRANGRPERTGAVLQLAPRQEGPGQLGTATFTQGAQAASYGSAVA